MKHIRILAAALAVMVPVGASAQVAPHAQAQSAEALSIELAELINPPQMIVSYFKSDAFAQGVRSGLASNPTIARMETQHPGIFAAMITRAQPVLAEEMQKILPALVAQLGAIYAQQMSVEDMREIIAFCRTPAGQHYLATTNQAALGQGVDIGVNHVNNGGDFSATQVAGAGVNASMSALGRLSEADRAAVMRFSLSPAGAAAQQDRAGNQRRRGGMDELASSRSAGPDQRRHGRSRERLHRAGEEVMKRAAMFAAALAALAPAAAFAQTIAVAAPPATAPLDPARLAEARKLIDMVMPPASREKMIRTMIDGMMGNISKFMNEDPTFASQDPAVRDVASRSIARMQTQMLDLLTSTMPEMVDAMTRAYARRFSVDELRQMEVFFGSPVGQAYISRVSDILTDPDVVAWQRTIMQRQMAQMPAMMDAIRHDVEAAAAAKARQGNPSK